MQVTFLLRFCLFYSGGYCIVFLSLWQIRSDLQNVDEIIALDTTRLLTPYCLNRRE